MSHKKPAGQITNPGRFSKGKSGNPRGRPAAKTSSSSHASALDIVMNKTLTITRNGVERQISAEEGLQHRTYQDAVAGKRGAQREVLRWIAKREGWRSKHASEAKPKIVVRHTSPDPDNADEALVLLGIAAIDSSRGRSNKDRLQLLLEPWAVQAALIRRRSATALSRNELDEAKRCTLDAESVRWPPPEKHEHSS